MKLLKKEVFDINKVTLVGSPTITDDGVLSNITTNDYINILPNIPTLSLSGNFEIKMKFTSPDLTRAQYDLISLNNFGFVIKIANTGALLVYLSSDGTGWNESNGAGTTTSTIKPNTTYSFKFGYNGTNYYIDISTDNKTFTQVFNKVGKALNSPKVNFNLGKGTGDNALIGGSIDLASFSITRDGQEIYNCLKPTYFMERRKEGFDLSKFTVVGSPNITEAGVASGFSASNYITQNITFTPNSFTEWTCKFTTGSDITSNQYVWRFYNGLTGSLCTNALGIKDGVIRVLYSDYSWLSYTCEPNKTYIVKTRYTREDVTVYIYDGDNTLLTTLNYTGDLVFMRGENSAWTVGIVTTVPSTYFQGLIDLTQFSITVDDKEVFTGAKEEYYMFK